MKKHILSRAMPRSRDSFSPGDRESHLGTAVNSWGMGVISARSSVLRGREAAGSLDHRRTRRDASASKWKSLFMALLSSRGISTPSLQAQGEQRRSSYFNNDRDLPLCLDQFAGQFI